MEISFNTKFNLGDVIYFYNRIEHKLCSLDVTKITYDITNNGVSIWYHSTEYLANEDSVFSSKEEFFDTLQHD